MLEGPESTRQPGGAAFFAEITILGAMAWY